MKYVHVDKFIHQGKREGMQLCSVSKLYVEKAIIILCGNIL